MPIDITQFTELIAGITSFSIIILYVYTSLALMTIAKKTNTAHAWFAWIPILNIYLMMRIADARIWTFIIFLIAGLIPIIGWLIILAIMIMWWWGIAKARNKSGILGILMLIPVLNLIILGYLAWSK
ncbi:hypothetical protein KY342_04595 [Candidatus Woesearchaeota archaeon]|nr:hypothetical protein [Candidatus Woesearchaeota archaeon]